MRQKLEVCLKSVVLVLFVLFPGVAVAETVQLTKEQKGFAPNNVYQVGEIDSVNVLNGDVMVRIPIGQTYSVGPVIQYQFMLSYNSKVWDQHFGWVPGDPQADQRFFTPEKWSNSGFGWVFSLGHLVVDRFLDEDAHLKTVSYVAPDGAETQFTAMDGVSTPDTYIEPSLFYAYSGQYLRLRRVGQPPDNAVFHLEFPDGQTHTFDAAGNLTRIEDKFGNWVQIDNAQTLTWTVRDGHGSNTARSHVIQFENVASFYPEIKNFQKRVTRADLAAFDGQPARYDFAYTDNASIGYQTWEPGQCFKGPLLQSVTLQDGSQYVATYNTIPPSLCGTNTINDGGGVLRSLQLPTHGSIEWDYGSYMTTIPHCYAISIGFETESTGVTRRVLKDHQGNVTNEWNYSPELVQSGYVYSTTKAEFCNDNGPFILHGPSEEFVNIVEGNDGMITKHYFSAWPEGAPQLSPNVRGFHYDEFGLPITHSRTKDGYLLSTEVFDCNTQTCSRNQFGEHVLPPAPIRRTYLKYARQPLYGEDGQPLPVLFTDALRPHMITGQLTELEIDPTTGAGAYYTKTDYDDHDGYGHLQRTVTSENFTGTVQTRTSEIDRRVFIAPTTWLLDLYTTSTVTAGGVTSKSIADFDNLTGALQSRRTLSGASTSSSDLLTVWCRDASLSGGSRGFVTSERYVGGDKAAIPAGDICGISTPAEGHYFLDHEYFFTGAKLQRHKAKWAGTSFYVADEEFDDPSGLVEKTRDASELATTYKYDWAARLTEVHPPKQAWTRYTYDRSTAPLRATVDLWPETTTNPPASSEGSLKDDHYYYDGQGRLLLSKTRLPGDVPSWAATALTYDDAGRVEESTVPVKRESSSFEAISTANTTKFSYDVFGRPTVVQSPDDSKTVTVYPFFGTRERQLRFIEAEDAGDPNAQGRLRSTEHYDGFGRLVSVTEPSGASGADVTTNYTYDLADRLRTVNTSNAGITQERVFTYDLRGWLEKEKHPEKGTDGNGEVHYNIYDARGHAWEKVEGDGLDAIGLSFFYDKAERLTKVRELDGLDLKEFRFEPDPGNETRCDGAERCKGRLLRATRYNHLTGGTITVNEHYTYDDAGRVHEKNTEVLQQTPTGNALINSFDLKYDYDEHFGLPETIHYPLPSVGASAVANGLTSVTQNYDRGVLSGIANFATLTYHPNGMVHEVRRATGGAIDTYESDHGLPRPASIHFSGLSGCALIQAQPEDRVLTQWNESAQFEVVVAQGTTVQWYEGVKPDTSHPVGTGPVLNTPPITNPKSYWARVSNADGTCTEDTVNVQASVCAPPAITIPAVDATSVTLLRAGDVLPFSVTAIGTNLTYTWLRQDGEGPLVVVGSGSTYTFNAVAADESVGMIRIIARVESAGCGATDRVVAIIDVNVVSCFARFVTGLAPVSRVPQSGGLDKQTVILETIEGATYSFRWYIDDHETPDGVEDNKSEPRAEFWLPVDGETIVRVEAWATCASNVQSQVITDQSYGIVDGVCPTVAVDVAPTKIVTGTNPTNTFTATVAWPAVTYQWYSGESGNTRSPKTNANTATFNAPMTAGTYWVRITDEECGTFVDSNTVEVETATCIPVRLTSEPQDMTIAAGTQIQLSVSASSVPASSNYQWFRGTGTALTGETQRTLDVAPLRTTDYSVQVRNGDCHTALSRLARIHVTSCSEIDIQQQPPAIVTVRDAEPMPALTVQATAVAPLRYQWYRGESGDDSNPIVGADNATFTPTLREDAQYWVRLQFDDPTKCAVDSRTVTVDICELPTLVGSAGHSNTTEPGALQSLSIHVNGDNLQYQWFEGEVGDETKPKQSISRIQHVKPLVTTNYWVRVTNACASGTDQVLNVGPVTASVCPRIGLQPTADKSVVMAGSTATITLDAQRADRVEWYVGAMPGNWTKIGETTSLTFTTPAINTTSTFWVRLHSGNCFVDSEPVIVAVCEPLSSIWSPTNKDKIEKGEFQTLEVHVGEVTEPLQYDFYEGGESGDVAGSIQHSSPTSAYGIQPTVTTKYWARATRTNSGCYTDLPTYVVQVCIPRITTQPAASTTINSGASAPLTVGTDLDDVTAHSLTYQWYVGQPGDTTNPVAGAIAKNFAPTPAVDTTYWVRVSGWCGISRDSAAASVTVCKPPVISQPPSNSNVGANVSTTLSVTATGTDLAYQWYRGVAPDPSTPVGSNSSYTTSLSTTTDFWVRITGLCGSVNSATVKISVPPAITTQPVGGSLMPSTTKNLTVAATGTQLRYEWYTQSSATPISGATSATYTAPYSATATTYFCRVYSGNNFTDSNPATISPCPALALAWSNVDTEITKSQYQVLSVTGVPASPVHTYQWYTGAAGNTANPISSQTNLGIQPTVTTSYWVRVTNSSTGCTTDSTAKNVRVCVPQITADPATSTMIDPGQSTLLSVTSDLSDVTYQWYVGNPGTTTQPISGATSNTYAAAPAADTTYWVRVTGSCGYSDDSTAAVVTVCKPAVITQHPSGATRPPNFVSQLGVTATGTELTYRWYQGVSGNTTTPLGSTSTTINVSPSVTTDYWVRVTGRCGTADSTTAKISVAPAINTQPVGGSITKGTTRQLSVAASGAQLAYQWYQRVGAQETLVSGATATSYTTPPINADATYFCRVSSGLAYTDSNDAVLSVCLPQAFGVSGANSVSGNEVTLTVTSPAGGETYEWYEGASGVTTALLGTGTTKKIYPAVTTQVWLRTKRTGCDADSTATAVRVCIPKINAQPQGGMVIAGTTKQLSVTAVGTGPLTYQWYTGAAGNTSNPISGATSASYTTPPVSGSTSYWVRVTGPLQSCSQHHADSTATTVSACQPPSISGQPSSSNLTSTQAVTLTVTASGDGLNYQWYQGAAGVTTNPVGSNSPSYFVTPGSTKSFWVRITGSCGTIDSAVALLSVYPTITQQPQAPANPVCINSSATFSIVANGATSFAWYRTYPGQSPQLVGSTATVSIPITLDGAEVYCEVSSGNAKRYSNTVTVTTNPAPTVYTLTAAPQAGGQYKLTATVAFEDQSLVAYRFYQGALGNTTQLLSDSNSPIKYVTPGTLPKSYWVRVYYMETGCYSDKAVTIQ